MAPNGNGRHSEEFELRLTKAEEKLIDHDGELLTVKRLLQEGMRFVVANERRSARRTAELDEKFAALVKAQMETEDSLKKLQNAIRNYIERTNGHGK